MKCIVCGNIANKKTCDIADGEALHRNGKCDKVERILNAVIRNGNPASMAAHIPAGTLTFHPRG
jgi:hypothetical protein